MQIMTGSPVVFFLTSGLKETLRENSSCGQKQCRKRSLKHHKPLLQHNLTVHFWTFQSHFSSLLKTWKVYFKVESSFNSTIFEFHVHVHVETQDWKVPTAPLIFKNSVTIYKSNPLTVNVKILGLSDMVEIIMLMYFKDNFWYRLWNGNCIQNHIYSMHGCIMQWIAWDQTHVMHNH